jgi:hypothetical protein
MGTGVEEDLQTIHKHDAVSSPISAATRIKNRRKRYLDLHPEYFSADLELAGPLALPV